MPPPAVDALAGMATAPAGMAMAASVVRPSATFTDVILRSLVIFMGCPFLGGATNLAGGRRPPRLCRLPLLASAAARVLRLGARLAVGRGGLAGWLGLPLGGAVGDQPGDRQEGLVEVFASSGESLEGAPLPELGVRVLDADAF